MSAYSVVDAKNSLPKLIDRALGGEEVLITRHGRPVVELKPTAARPPVPTATYAWLMMRRQGRPGIGMTSVELLDQLYESESP